MGYLIRMAPEVEEWLAAVRDRDPAAADLIDEAVAALRAGGTSVGPPLVVPLDDPSLDPRPDLELSYQRQLEMLTRVRRAVADVATWRKRLELQASQLEQQIGKLGDQSRKAMEEGRGDLAEQARARRDAVREQCSQPAPPVRRRAGGRRARRRGFSAPASQGGRLPDPQGGHQGCLHGGAGGGRGRVGRGGNRRRQRRCRRRGSCRGRRGEHAALYLARNSLPLSELRPGAPESAGTRILFTVEPSGTAVLLAASVESDRLRAWYTEAIANCRVRYQR